MSVLSIIYIFINILDTPSKPRDVKINGDPLPTAVNISWRHPASFGTFTHLDLFQLTLSTTVNTSQPINYTNETHSVDITGLSPNTPYTVSIRGLAYHLVLGTVFGNSSHPVHFNTTPTSKYNNNQ